MTIIQMFGVLNCAKGDFHDGAAFTADAVYSFNGTMPTSAMKELLTSVKEVRKVDDYTIDMETNGANPLLINNLTNLFMMDSGWTEANDASAPQDVAAGETTFAAQNTNGTGAYMLKAVCLIRKLSLRLTQIIG